MHKATVVIALCLACFLAGGLTAQTAGAQPGQPERGRASAYYNYSMGHLYAELAGLYGNRGEYLDKAIEHYKLAMKADPGATFLAQELSDLYIQAGKLSDAVQEAEEMLKRDPANIEAHRILGRIYTRMIGDAAQGKINENMLRRATEQYQKITEKDAKDTDAWVTLGRLHKMAQNSVEAEKAYTKALELDASNEYALHGLALLYSDLGDTKAAIQMWQRLAEQDPNPRVLRALAASYEQMREYASAVQTLRRALEMAPRDAEIKRELAENLLVSEQLDEALKLYEELAAASPKDPGLPLRISQIHRQRRDLAKAREAQDNAKALDAESIEIRYNEVNLLEAEGKFPEAVARLKEILDSTAKKSYAPAERGNRVIMLERLGLLYRANEQAQQAVEAFRQVAELDPDLGARAAAQIVEAYRGDRQFARAEQEAEAAHKKYPNDRTVRLMRASVLADIGKAAQAIADVEKLLDGKNDRDTHLALAQLYDKAKDYQGMTKALDAAEKLSESKEEKEGILFMRAAMHERMKNYAESEAQFRKVLEMNPKNASALNYLGYMFADRDVNLQEAHALISRALELDPHNGAYLDSLGWVYYRMGKLNEAETCLLRSLQRVPRDPTIHDHLGDVYLRQGKLKEAIAQWQTSLREWEAGSRADLDPTEVAKAQKKLEGAKIRLAKESTKAAGQQR